MYRLPQAKSDEDIDTTDVSLGPGPHQELSDASNFLKVSKYLEFHFLTLIENMNQHKQGIASCLHLATA